MPLTNCKVKLKFSRIKYFVLRVVANDNEHVNRKKYYFILKMRSKMLLKIQQINIDIFSN